jgi:hypothetical protein
VWARTLPGFVRTVLGLRKTFRGWPRGQVAALGFRSVGPGGCPQSRGPPVRREQNIRRAVSRLAGHRELRRSCARWTGPCPYRDPRLARGILGSLVDPAYLRGARVRSHCATASIPGAAERVERPFCCRLQRLLRRVVHRPNLRNPQRLRADATGFGRCSVLASRRAYAPVLFCSVFVLELA